MGCWRRSRRLKTSTGDLSTPLWRNSLARRRCCRATSRKGSPPARSDGSSLRGPERIRFASPAKPGAVEGRVLSVTYYGHDASVAVALDAGGDTVTARVAGH